MEDMEKQIIDYEEIFDEEDKKPEKKDLEENIKETNKYVTSIALYFIIMMLGIGALIASIFIKPFVAPVDYSNPTYDVMEYVDNNEYSMALVDKELYYENYEQFLSEDDLLNWVVIGEFLVMDNLNLLIANSPNIDDINWLINDEKINVEILNDILEGKIKKWDSSNKNIRFVVNPKSDIYLSNNYNIEKMITKGNKTFVLALNQNNLFVNLMQISIYLMISIPLFVMFRPSLKVDYIDFKKKDKSLLSQTLTGISYMLVVQVVLGLITFGLQSLRGGVSQSVNQAAIESSMVGPSAILLILTVVFLGPFVEEVIFRKSIFGLMKNDKLAILFSGFLFGLIHLTGETHFIDVLIQGIPYVGMGLFLGYYYTKNDKNLLLMTLIHSGYNLLTVIFMFLQ